MEQFIMVIIGLCMLCSGVYMKVKAKRASVPTMKVECAWCGVHMDGDVESTVISHGICPTCRDSVMGTLRAKVGSSKREYGACEDAWSHNRSVCKHGEEY